MARQRRDLASRTVALNTLTRAIPPAGGSPADLAGEMEAILGVTIVDKIWPEENRDDEVSSVERTFLCHTESTLQARRARQRVRRCIDKINAGCALEVLSVRGPTAESNHEAVRSFINWADILDLALVEDDAIDRVLCFFMTNCFFGRENELGGRTV